MENKKHPSGKHLETVDIARKLFQLARLSAQDINDPTTRHAFNDMTEIVIDCLARGRDDILEDAAQKALECSDAEAHDELEEACEFESSCVVATSPDGSEEIKIHLFAIPIIVNIDAGSCPYNLPRSAEFYAIAHSIRNFGMVEGDPAIHILNYLYDADQLDDLRHSDVFALANNILANASKENAGDSALLHQTVIGPTEVTEAQVELRYLIGIFVTDGDDQSDDAVIEAMVAGEHDELDDDDEAFQNGEATPEEKEKMLNWQRHVAILMASVIGRDSKIGHVIVGPLDQYYMALYQGQIERDNVEMHIYLDKVVTRSGLRVSTLHAIIAPYGPSDEAVDVRMTIIAPTGECIGGYVYPVRSGEIAEEVIAEVCGIVERIGFGNISTTNTLQSSAADSEDDKYFLKAAPDELVSSKLPKVPFPTSMRLH